MLTLMYIAFAVIGCGYVLVSAFLGHLGFEDSGHAAGHGGGEHVHVHHAAGESYGLGGQGHGSTSAGHSSGGGFHFPFFSPLAVSTLLAAVGGYGLIALHGLHAGEGTSLLIALPAAFVTTYGITYAAWRMASDSQGTSVIRISSMAGSPAEVTVPIPAGGVGEVVAMVEGQRFPAPAREVSGREVLRGTPVQVVQMIGPTLIVTVENTSNERGSA